MRIDIQCVILTFCLSFGATTTFAGGDISTDDIKRIMDKGAKAGEEITAPNHHNKEAEDAARKAAELFHSKDFQTRIQNETERIKRELFHDQLKVATSDRTSQPPVSMLAKNERLYLFISSSVPKDTLRRYAASMDAIGDPSPIVMIMRGFIGGMVKVMPTVNFVSEVMIKDNRCDYLTKPCDRYPQGVQVDPLLFRRYKITRVPALVYVTGVNPLNSGSEGIKENVAIGESWVVYGDAGLGYLIERLRAKSKSSSLKKMIDILQNKGFFDDNRE